METFNKPVSQCFKKKEKFEEIKEINNIGHSVVYDFTVEHNNHRYWAGDGISSHNTGKTFLALNIVREAQKKGYYVIYIDTENAIDKELVSKFGINTNMFRIDPMSTVEQFKIYMAKFIDKLDNARKEGKVVPKVLIVLDSLGDLASEKEVSDAVAGEMKADMTRSKQLKAVFRIITSKLGILGIPMVLTNHTYMTQDMFPKEVFSGGTGGIYNCSTIGMLSKAKLKVGDEDELYSIGQSGIIITIKTDKNRFAIPGKIKIELDFNEGANPYKYLETWCTAENFQQIGIAKGKMDVDKETGEEYFKPGGNFWYVRHLGKSVPGKALHTARVFTQEVLEAMAPIAEATFKYASAADADAMVDKLDEFEENVNNSDFGMTQSAEDLNGSTLFE